MFTVAPFSTDAADTVYEFENGTISDIGDNVTSVVSPSGASGGKVVDLKDSRDSVTVKINANNAEVQKLTIRYSQPYDENEKYKDIIVNGRNIRQIFCAYTGEGKFSTVSVSANLSKGENTATVEGSWEVDLSGLHYSRSRKLRRHNSQRQARKSQRFGADSVSVQPSLRYLWELCYFRSAGVHMDGQREL